MDPELQRRWKEQNDRWWRRHLDEEDQRERRRQLFHRYRWPIRIAAGFAIALVVAEAGLLGWFVGERLSTPSTVFVHVEGQR